jgi:hypothetical protein
MEFSEYNTLMSASRLTIVFVLQKNMEAIKVEPDSDDETHHTSPQNEYFVTDGKAAYPVHAEFLVVKAEHEVGFTLHQYLFDYYCVLQYHMHFLCNRNWSVVYCAWTSYFLVVSRSV